MSSQAAAQNPTSTHSLRKVVLRGIQNLLGPPPRAPWRHLKSLALRSHCACLVRGSSLEMDIPTVRATRGGQEQVLPLRVGHFFSLVKLGPYLVYQLGNCYTLYAESF